MIWKNKYKRRNKTGWLNKSSFLNFKTKIINPYQILLWILAILIFYSIIQYNFFSSSEKQNSRVWNKEQIKKLNLEELYKLKNLEHHEVKIWVLNNTNQRGLAAKIRDCLEKGYYIGDEHIKGDYNVLKQDNYGKIDQYDMGYMDGLKTEIFVHVDTVNNPKFQLHIKEFLLFTGYSNNIVKYKYQEKLYNERDITIILGEDWDRIGNLPLCNNSIN